MPVLLLFFLQQKKSNKKMPVLLLFFQQQKKVYSNKYKFSSNFFLFSWIFSNMPQNIFLICFYKMIYSS
jgi:hypothetical protein